MVNSKHAFWMALVFAIVVFTVGMIFGYFIEQNRISSVDLKLTESEIYLLDEQIRNDRFLANQDSCKEMRESTFDFADRIYQEALSLERYDSSSKFGRELKIVHKKYDLMRVMLFNEGLYIQSKCNETLHTVVYFFNYDGQDVNNRALQTAYSRVLIDFKDSNSDQVLLIPIAANLDLSSVDLLLSQYKVTQVPSVLIDGKYVISDLDELNDIEKIVFNSNKE